MEDGRASVLAAQPHARLRPYVSRYVGYRSRAGTALHRGLPSPNITLVVAVGAPIEVVQQTDPSQPPAQYRVVFGGLHSSVALIANPSIVEGIEVELPAIGLRGVLGMPAAAVWNRSYEFADVVGAIGYELWERMQEAHGWPARFATCDEVLGRIAVDCPADPDVAFAWQRLNQTGGRVPIEVLAREVGLSRQCLRARFVREFGLSPKRAARIIRFHRACAMLSGPSRPQYGSIVGTAAECGYFDQAHLTRDFVEFAGCSPTQWLSEQQAPAATTA